MGNNRPSTQRKHTRKTEESRADALEQGIRITLDGAVYTVRLGDITSTVARELRSQAGLSVNQLMQEITTSPDVDIIASFVWLARRLSGDDVAHDDVVISYTQLLGDGFDVSLPDKREVDDSSPEA